MFWMAVPVIMFVGAVGWGVWHVVSAVGHAL